MTSSAFGTTAWKVLVLWSV